MAWNLLLTSLEMSTAVIRPSKPSDARQMALLYVMVVATLLFNVLDGVLTLISVHSGAAIEVNPLLADLAVYGPVRFMLIKITLVSLGVWLLWRRRRHAWATTGICAVFMCYAGLIAYHLGMIA